MPSWWLLWLLGGVAIGALAATAFPWPRRRAEDAVRRTDIENLTAELQARQQQAIEALRLNHARWQTLAEALTVGVVLLGRDRRILLTNTAARRALAILGAPAGVGRLEHLGPRPLDEVLASHREPAPVEIQVDESRAATGRQWIFEVSAKPVVAGTGGEWVLTLADVTGERETARRLWLRERLAAVGQLAAGIAHDFNNLLQSITLAAEMSHQGARGDGSRTGGPGGGVGEPSPAAAEDPELLENLEIILQQSRRAAELVRQILDFARQSPTRSRILALGPLIEETVGLLQRTLPDSVVWQLELDGDHRVQGDPAQIQQILTNLAVNADAAMPDGGTLRIALAETLFANHARRPSDRMPAGPWVTLTVSDTGCGMSSDLLKRIFEPFFTTKGRAQGTGLGLSQVYGIVEQQGGFIDVASTVGVGTTFTIYLPPATEDGDVATAESAPVEIPEGRGELVLVVDDDEAILRGAKMALLSFGYRVLTTPDTAAALELVERHGDDLRLVLADVALPRIRKAGLLPRLRERSPDVALLFMSGYAPRTDGEPAAPAEADVLEKPFSLDELATAISRALQRHRRHRRSPTP